MAPSTCKISAAAQGGNHIIRLRLINIVARRSPARKPPSKKKDACLLITALNVALLLLFAVTGCSSVSPDDYTVSAEESGAVLYSDDFSKPPSGWGTWSRGGALVEYHNGGLRILINETQYDFWSVAGQKFTDASIEVDAEKIGGPDDNDFGIVCRYQDKENFYMLVSSSDGYYGVAKIKAGQYSMIGAEQLQYSSAILQGQAVNRVRADCIGNTLTMYANGQKLMEAQDSDFLSGDVGVLAGAYNTQGVEILFDNFVVKKP